MNVSPNSEQMTMVWVGLVLRFVLRSISDLHLANDCGRRSLSYRLTRAVPSLHLVL